MPATSLPALPFEAWSDTRVTLHLVCQMVGKVRMALHPPKNHWWHVTLYVTPRGLTTGLIPLGEGSLEIEVDFEALALEVSLSSGEAVTLPLRGKTVADVHDVLFAALAGLGVDVTILARPYELDFDTPFAQDRDHGAWDADAVARYHRILAWTAGVLETFSGRFVGKQTPVHLFWHSFDLAVTRFSGSEAPPLPEGANAVTREAYSHQVVSFGFWAGDPSTPEPTFYAYAHPEPDGLTDAPLEPEGARWEDTGGGHQARVAYETIRTASDPEAALLAFLESAYQAGARGMGWNVDALKTSWAP